MVLHSSMLRFYLGASLNFDVIIIGGGLVGASLALALGKAGLKVAVVEPKLPQARSGVWDARIYAISPGSAAFLDSCGIWGQLDRTRICQVEEMRIFGDESRSELGFNAYDAGLRELAIILENRALQETMWRALPEVPNIDVVAPAECENLLLAENAAELTLKDGRILRARLIVGADGADSWVRQQAGIEVDTRQYGQMAVVANFSTEKAHRNTAFQWFLRAGVLALLPLPGKHVSMVWSVATERAEELLALTHQELAACVTLASGGVVGDLQVMTPAAAFPLRIQRVARLIAPRLALVGDAAHNVHPLAGQGVNLGFRDARELAHVLGRSGAQTDCGDYYLLRQYERARAEDIAAMRLATDTLQKLFGSASPTLRKLRNFGLRVTDRQLFLKNLFIQHAVA